MKSRRRVASRGSWPCARWLSLAGGLLAALLALSAGADPTAPQAGERPSAPATPQAAPTAPARSPDASSEKPAAAGRSEASSSARPQQAPKLPTRQSVRAEIESIDPSSWLSRYGLVERRELP